MSDFQDDSSGPPAELPAPLVALLRKLARPAREVRDLSSDERAMTLSVLLAAMVPMDRKVLEVEIERLNQLAQQHYRVSGTSLVHIESLARGHTFSVTEIEIFSTHLADRLHIEDRCNLVGLLWEVALCDQHLHELEAQAIHAVAEKLGVPRKRTLEQQARAALRV